MKEKGVCVWGGWGGGVFKTASSHHLMDFPSSKHESATGFDSAGSGHP